jgi:hypothetical protein
MCSVYESPESLEADYLEGKLHPKDLKAALTVALNQ